MTSSLWRFGVLALALAPAWGGPYAQDVDDTQSLTRVTVTGAPRDVMPYDDFLAGLAVFRDDHDLAPQATMKFQIIARRPDIQLSDVTLHLVTASGSTPPEDIAVAADGTFAVPVHPELAGQGAEIRSSLPAGSFHWRDLVLSPDQPDNTRRMGDLRLECEVKEVGELNRPDLPFWSRLLSSRSKSECYSRDEHFFLAARALTGVSLDDGSHHASIAADRIAESSAGHLIPRSYSIFEPGLRERAYSPPLEDAQWSNNTVVSFTYSDAPDASQGPIS